VTLFQPVVIDAAASAEHPGVSSDESPLLLHGVLAGALTLTAFFLYWIHGTQPASEPGAAVRAWMLAASRGRFDDLGRASTPAFRDAFVRHFGAQKRERVDAVYRRAFDLAMPVWRSYRMRGDALANTTYWQLRQQVEQLGRQAFEGLPPEQQVEVYGQGLVDDYIFNEGHRRLPESVKPRIPDPGALRTMRDREAFVRAWGFDHLSKEDRAALKSPAVLADEPTPEKLAFLERMGLPRLSAADRREIQGIPRRDLNDPSSFDLEQGEPAARLYLGSAGIPATIIVQRCSFPLADRRGSLLRGDRATCIVEAAARGGSASLEIALLKDGFRWLIEGTNPQLYAIGWQE
jgi:hypothetical protein